MCVYACVCVRVSTTATTLATRHTRMPHTLHGQLGIPSSFGPTPLAPPCRLLPKFYTIPQGAAIKGIRKPPLPVWEFLVLVVLQVLQAHGVGTLVGGEVDGDLVQVHRPQQQDPRGVEGTEHGDLEDERIPCGQGTHGIRAADGGDRQRGGLLVQVCQVRVGVFPWQMMGWRVRGGRGRAW
jgi:hypothetical protein